MPSIRVLHGPPKQRFARRLFLLFALTSACLFAHLSLGSDLRESVGWNRLVEELGEQLPSGREIKFTLVESTANGGYQPDTGNFDFAGKSFGILSGEAEFSAHATAVGQRLFGNSQSMAGGIGAVDVYEAEDWLLEGFLKVNREPLPAVETSRIQNHSWVGAFDEERFNVEAIRRLDFAIERDRFLAVVALGNDTGELPSLIGHAYNAITVGRMDGSHSRGGTRLDGPGRIRPDLVAPGGLFTSFSAPVVSSAAALLLEEADRTEGLLNARANPQVMRAILMAGATKDPFPGWIRSEARPLDEVFGVGRLDVYQSHRILTGGEQEAENEETLSEAGWDFNAIAVGDSATYFVSFDEKQRAFTAHLAWHRLVGTPADLNFTDVAIEVPFLTFRLFEASGRVVGKELQASADPLGNNQHVFIKNLAAGEYALVVTREDAGQPVSAEYGLAWNGIAAKEGRATTFAAWQNRSFSAEERGKPEVSGSHADPDGDGVRNLLEYALGSDPWREELRGNSIRSETATIAGEKYLTLIFRRPLGLIDVDYRVAVSLDLVEWENEAVPVSVVLRDDETEELIFRYPEPVNAGSRGFLRLEVNLK